MELMQNQDEGKAYFSSISEFLLTHPVLSFGIQAVSRCRLRHTEVLPAEEENDNLSIGRWQRGSLAALRSGCLSWLILDCSHLLLCMKGVLYSKSISEKHRTDGCKPLEVCSPTCCLRLSQLCLYPIFCGRPWNVTFLSVLWCLKAAPLQKKLNLEKPSYRL